MELSRRKWLGNCLKKCNISNAVDGTEDSEIYWDDETSEDTGNTEIEEDDTSDTDSDKEFLAFYDV